MEYTRSYERSCESKSGVYFDHASALVVASDIFAAKGEVVYPYRCMWCKLFHLAHPKQEKITAKPGDWIDWEAIEQKKIAKERGALRYARIELLKVLTKRVKKFRRDEAVIAQERRKLKMINDATGGAWKEKQRMREHHYWSAEIARWNDDGGFMPTWK